MSTHGGNRWFLLFILILLIFGLKDHHEDHDHETYNSEKGVV
ncbi:hypothetical protein cpu_06630 [Carboxydothermus pertinax]|uniref:Uncharacterized protein n=1 Tax=Carboxydothermus pertinax TaxID=870242 RepID=A0A1L8CTB9_9THEO|nr:hypothetical protein cpu_06630 [Carboxydothermus pertinax]